MCQTKALAANPPNPQYRQFLRNDLENLARACAALGDEAGAADARLQLDELTASDPRFAAVDVRLAAVLKGEATRDNAERLALAQRAYDVKRYSTAAKLWSEALVADPKLADDLQRQHRYNAACAAALAASGAGNDILAPDDVAKVKLRTQALAWLKAELAAWKRVSMIVEPGNKQLVAKTLAHWKQDTDLAAIRDTHELAKLPDDERAALEQLWKETDALLTQVRNRK